tara:strand:+ start:211 stop:393 length:183 start_codon:yes stop_codon:yes gene_type:complete
MKVKKQAIENIKKKLEYEQNKINSKLKMNCYEIRRIGIENETMKREKAKLGELIKSLDVK